MDVSAHGEARPDTPELPAERLTARSTTLVRLITVRPGRGMRDDDVGVQGDVVP